MNITRNPPATLFQPGIFFRFQPKNKSIFTWTSEGSEESLPKGKIFAYEAEAPYLALEWFHANNETDEVVFFKGKGVYDPGDYEGVAVTPTEEVARMSIKNWLKAAAKVDPNNSESYLEEMMRESESNPPRRRARNSSFEAYQFINILKRHADLWETFARQYSLPMPLLKISNVVGCGFYGCTFETTTPGVGFKITKAWDEASLFAWQQSTQTAGIVPAYAVVGLPGLMQPYLIWRDLLDVCCEGASESLFKEGHLRPGYNDVLRTQQMDTSLEEQMANGIELVENYQGLGDIGHALINASESGYVIFDLHPKNLGRWLDHNQLVIFDAGWKVKNEIYPTLYTLVKGADGVELMTKDEWLERERKDEDE